MYNNDCSCIACKNIKLQLRLFNRYKAIFAICSLIYEISDFQSVSHCRCFQWATELGINQNESNSILIQGDQYLALQL